ncbi:MAG: energy transducer TonB [Deltaproteobacteria bacterium]|nr:energy transducer TonB [Deltaproteobacteria bacterium]
MSTGYFPHTGRVHLPLFLILSLAAHLAVIFLMTFYLPQQENKLDRLIPVEFISLPKELQGRGVAPDTVKRYAHRSQKVERETVPEQVIQTRPSAVVKVPGIVVGKRGGGGKSSRKGRAKAKEQAVEEGSGIAVAVPAEERVLDRKSGATLPPGETPLALYPTRERLAALSEDYSKAAPKAEKGKILALNTTEHRYAYYMDGIKRKIELQWDYPNPAIKNGQQGALNITFVLRRDGTIKSMKLEHGSGYPILDNAALTAIKLAAPFHPFPDGYELNDLTIQASFEYVLNFLRGRN